MQSVLALSGGRTCGVPRHVVQARQLQLRPICLVPLSARSFRCCGGRHASWFRPAATAGADGVRVQPLNVQADIAGGADAGMGDLSNWQDWLKGPEEHTAAATNSSLPTAVSDVMSTPGPAAEQAGSTTLLPDWLDAATHPPAAPVSNTSLLPSWLSSPLEASSTSAAAAEPAAAAAVEQATSAASAAAEELLNMPLAVVQAPSAASEQALTAAAGTSNWFAGIGSGSDGDAVASSTATSSSPWSAWLQAPADAAATSTTQATAAADKASSLAGGWFGGSTDAAAEAADAASGTGGLSDWMAAAADPAAGASAKEAVAVRNPFAGWMQGGAAASSSSADAAAASSSSAADAVSTAASSFASDLVQAAAASGDVSGAAAEAPGLQLPSFTPPDFGSVPEQLKALPFKLPTAVPEFKLPELPTGFPHLPESLQMPDHLPSSAELLPGGLGALLEAHLPLPDISLPMAGAAAAAGGAGSALAALLEEGGVPWVQAAGVVGFLLGALALSLYSLERDARQKLAAEVEELKAGLAAKEEELQQLNTQLEEEKKARSDAESWLPRLKDAEKDIFKLERALELKDGQLETFITTAHRQIKLLEQRIKDQQKMPR